MLLNCLEIWETWSKVQSSICDLNWKKSTLNVSYVLGLYMHLYQLVCIYMHYSIVVSHGSQPFNHVRMIVLILSSFIPMTLSYMYYSLVVLGSWFTAICICTLALIRSSLILMTPAYREKGPGNIIHKLCSDRFKIFCDPHAVVISCLPTVHTVANTRH